MRAGIAGKAGAYEGFKDTQGRFPLRNLIGCVAQFGEGLRDI